MKKRILSLLLTLVMLLPLLSIGITASDAETTQDTAASITALEPGKTERPAEYIGYVDYGAGYVDYSAYYDLLYNASLYSDFPTNSYCLWDIDGNGVWELILYGENSWLSTRYEFFTIDEYGQYVFLGGWNGMHRSLVYHPGYDSLYLYMGKQGSYNVQRLDLYGTELYMTQVDDGYNWDEYPYWGENVRMESVTDYVLLQEDAYRLTYSFRDVSYDKFYYDPVNWAAYFGITNGTSPNYFAPDMPCTRAQVVTFLWRAAGEPEPYSNWMPFRDVPYNAFYRDAVLWAVETGITTGVSATKFSPNSTCTRGQVVTFLYRAADEPYVSSTWSPFRDVSNHAFYYNAVVWATYNGITSGTSSNRFSPDAQCTRGQVVTFLYRAADGK